MSSHREAPEISKDPSADNTDLYAFVSPDKPDTVTLIANYIPFQLPYGGPNFNEFADDVQYRINVSNTPAAEADVSYVFEFETRIRNPKTFLYNTGQITSITDTKWNRPQTYTVTREVQDRHGRVRSTVLGRGLTCPPCNVGERSTPHYQATFGDAAVHSLGGGRKVFAGQRSDPFYVDLGSVFDLAGLRPLNQAHLIKLPIMQGMDGLRGLNVHSIALQVPKSELTANGRTPTDPTSSDSVIGVWATASRARARVYDREHCRHRPYGGWVQVSRLGNPLVNEVINPMAVKDRWNAVPPKADGPFAKYVDFPELQGILPVLYPGVFPNLDAFGKSDRPRTDLHAILLTGIPASVLGGAFTTFTGPIPADLLRLNMAVPPTPAGKVNPLGVVAGDAAGFPNGRRLVDDVTTIELRAVAGLTIPLTYPDYKPDDVLSGDAIRDGSTNENAPLLGTFPYIAPPASGYLTVPPAPAVSRP